MARTKQDTWKSRFSQASFEELKSLEGQINDPEVAEIHSGFLAKADQEHAWRAPGQEFNFEEDIGGLIARGPTNDAVANDLATTISLVDADNRNDFVTLPAAMQVNRAEVDAGNTEALSAAAVASHIQDKQKGLIEALAMNPEIADEDGLDGVASAIAADREIPDNLDPLDVVFVDKYAPVAVAMDPKQRDVLAAQFSIDRMLAERMEEVGIWDRVSSFATLFMPSREVAGVDAVTEHFGADSLNDFKDVLSGMPPQQQVEVATFIFDEIQEIQPNVFIAETVFNKAIDLDPEDFNSVKLWAILDFFEIGAVAAVLARTATRLNGIRKAVALQNKDLTAVAVKSAADNPEIASRLNTNTTEVQSSLHAAETEMIYAGSTDDVASEAGKLIEETVAATRRELEKFVEQPIGLLNADEIAAAVKKTSDEVDLRNASLKAQGLPERVEILEVDKVATGVNMRVRLDDGSTVTVKHDLGKDLERKFTGELTGSFAASKLATPLTFLSGFKDQLVDTATFIGFQKSRNSKILQDATKRAFKGLSNKEIKRVDDMLVEGDELSEVFTLEKLRSEFGFNDKEAAAYFGSRAVIDRGFTIVNASLRRQLEVDGWGYLRLKQSPDSAVTSINSPKVFLKEVDEAPTAGTRVWDSATSRVVSIVDEPLDEAGTFYRTRDPIVVRQEGTVHSVDLVMGGAKLPNRLPRTVLNRQVGYLPRSRESINYVVRRKITTSSERTYLVTERLASRLDDANATAAKLNREAGIPEGRDDSFKVSKSNELTPEDRDELAINSYGGLITSSRSKRDILFGYDGEKATRVNARDSLERMMGNVAHAGTVSEWRNQVIIKFKNSYGHTLENPDSWTSKVKNVSSEKERAQAEFLQRWIKANLNLPTREDAWFKRTMQSIAEGMERHATKGGRLDGARNAILEFSTKDPWAASRAAAFHGLLGAWNPGQLLVQGMGFTVALSLDPLNAVRNTERAVIANSLVGFIEKIDNVDMLRSMSDRVWKPFGFSSREEVVDFVTAYKKSGLRESIRSNADYESALSGFSIDRSAIDRAAQWGKSSSLLFSRAGELWNRSYGFSAAYNEWRKANKGKRLTSVNDIAEVTQRSTHFTLNLNHANAAAWQSGPTGSLLQFMQINQKFVEEVAFKGAQMSGAQRMSMVLGQIAMFGTNTIPINEDWTSRKLLEATNTATDDVVEMERRMRIISQGFVGALFDYITHDDFDFGDRFAIGAGLGGFVEGLWSTIGDVVKTRPIELPSTPSSSFAGRIIDFTMHLYNLFSRGAVFDGLSKEEYLGAMQSFGNIFSSAKSATKAWVTAQHGGEIYSTSGALLFTIEPEETDIFTMAMGFRLSQEQDYYELLDAAQFTKEVEQDIAKALARHILVYRPDDLQSPEKQAQLAREMSAMLYHTIPEGARERVRQRVYDSLTEEKYPEVLKKVIAKMFEGYELTDNPMTPNPLPVRDR